jgi:hypothetical protein
MDELARITEDDQTAAVMARYAADGVMTHPDAHLSRYPQAMATNGQLMAWWCRDTEGDMAGRDEIIIPPEVLGVSAEEAGRNIEEYIRTLPLDPHLALRMARDERTYIMDMYRDDPHTAKDAYDADTPIEALNSPLSPYRMLMAAALSSATVRPPTRMERIRLWIRRCLHV